jgi:acyl dehydratase
MPDIYFEDLEEGECRELGSYTIPKDEMMQFATRYDPQPIHTDEAAASESIFGGVIASGWYTAGICMRLLVEEFLNDAASMGAHGLEELKWPTPVHAGDTLTVENKIMDTRASESRNDRGYARNLTTGYNQNDDEVIRWIAVNIFARRA